MVECVYCKEDIQEDTVVCPSCLRKLPLEPPAPTPVPVQTVKANGEFSFTRRRWTRGTPTGGRRCGSRWRSG